MTTPQIFPVLADAIAETEGAERLATVGLAPETVADNSLSILVERGRFESMDRIRATEAGAMNASWIARKLDLSPAGLEALGTYLAESGLELKRRAMDARAAALREATDAWRAAGRPGAHVAPPEPERPRSSAVGTADAVARMRELLAGGSL